MYFIASFLQLLGKEITLSARGNLPLAFRLAVLDGLDGIMNNDMAQVGAAGKGIDANLLHPFGNVDRLERVEILERVILDFLDIVREDDADGVLTGRADGNLVFTFSTACSATARSTRWAINAAAISAISRAA